LVSWLIAGHLDYAAAIVSLEVVVKLAVYFWREKVWNAISWGRQNTK
jgi:uncharacterized membrane protein